MKTPTTTGGRLAKARAWINTPASVTRGWLLLSTLIGFVFVGCAIYAAVTSVRVDNRVTREESRRSASAQVETCMSTNERRREARNIAAADVAEDRRIWESIDDLFPTGLPEPARSIVFDGLDSRTLLIAATYQPVDCGALAASLGLLEQE